MFLISSNTTNSTVSWTQIFPTTTPSDLANPLSNFWKWVYIVFYSIICLSGVCGNFMVILASRKPGMITVSNILIANLAVADFTVCLFNVPYNASFIFLWYHPFGSSLLCKIITFLLSLTLCASIGTLVAIAGERYWHIVLYTRRKLTVREAYKVIAVIWWSSIFISLPLALFSKTVTHKEGDTEVIYCIEEWTNVESRQAYTTLLFLLSYILPLLLIFGLYVQIGRFLRSLPATQQVNYQVQKKTIYLLFIVVLLFGLCWLPFHIVTLYIELSGALVQSTSLSLLYIHSFSLCLMCANSACNPVVYAVLNKNYRRQFSTILCSFRQRVLVQPAPGPAQ